MKRAGSLPLGCGVQHGNARQSGATPLNAVRAPLAGSALVHGHWRRQRVELIISMEPWPMSSYSKSVVVTPLPTKKSGVVHDKQQTQHRESGAQLGCTMKHR